MLPSAELRSLAKWNVTRMKVVILQQGNNKSEGAVPNQQIVQMLNRHRTTEIDAH